LQEENESPLTDSNNSYIVLAMNKDKMELFKAKCKEKKVKITPQRNAIYEELINDNTHPSVDEVYKRINKKFSNISFDTVYRTVILFADIGLIKRVGSYKGHKKFDTNIDIHHHLCCIECGKIIDFKNKEYDELDIPGNIKNKYKVLGKRVVLEFICKECSKEK
jgi:Fur family transcriptional regulator, peroxide stress response regulator